MKRRKEAHDEKNQCIRCFDSRYALYAVRMWENRDGTEYRFQKEKHIRGAESMEKIGRI